MVVMINLYAPPSAYEQGLISEGILGIQYEKVVVSRRSHGGWYFHSRTCNLCHLATVIANQFVQ